MLDGILGRGFASKCKSSIKVTKTRIEAIRRKRTATQKFLKNDIADLVANGLDAVAYGRAEGLLVELGLSSCYDFVELSCECILKHLSVMQKQSECPEECKMAVSSLMFAAARFSDLPELRDLRNLFQDKYGNSLEYFVNQKFVETLASKSPTLEMKAMLLEDIASEFSIKWDSRGLDLRVPTPPVSPLNQHKTYGSPSPDKYKLPNGKDDKYKLPDGKDYLPRLYKHDTLANVMHEQTTGSNGVVSKRDEEPHFFGSHNSKNKPPRSRKPTYLDGVNHDISVQPRREFRAEHHESSNGTEQQRTAKEDRSAHGEKLECSGGNIKLNNGLENTRGTEIPDKSDHQKELSFADGGNHYAQEELVNSIRNLEEETGRVKPYTKFAIPPPYTKPSHSRYGVNLGSKHAGYDVNGAPLDPSTCIGADAGSGLEGMKIGAESPGYDREIFGPVRVNSHEEHLNQDEMNPTPRRRSSRRRHLKSPPSRDDTDPIVGTGTPKRSSSSSRRNMSKTDEEENMIDKLLIQYSKKPSSFEADDVRQKLKAKVQLHRPSDAAGEILQKCRSRDGPEKNPPKPPSRSISLPNDKVAQLETPNKAFIRAATMQPAGHVHPKLPDYDDLAAKFAAMKGNYSN